MARGYFEEGVTRLSDSKALALAGVFLSITAAMHLGAIILAGLHFSTVLFLVIGLIYLSIARTYLGRSDLWTWPGLILMGIGISGALIMIHFGSAIPGWWLWAIVWMDVAVALSLLWFLWRR